jgi:hypothetical protein
MNQRIELLKADIQDELIKIEKLCEEFQILKPKLLMSADQVNNFDRSVIGYYLHNFYNGCETIFKSISRFFENDLSVDSWHRDLLKRMKLNIDGYRPAVINEELYLILDDFRAFRHKFRHCYTFELNWERMKIVANKLDTAWKNLQSQLKIFLRELDNIKEE